MKKQISKKKINKMINSGFVELSIEEIKELIRYETEKDENQIDMDYIDMCFELISIKQNDISNKKRHYKNPVKIIFVAAVICILFISSITAFAKVFNYNIPQEIAKFIDGDVKFDINNNDADTEANGYSVNSDLVKELSKQGISPVTIPSELCSNKCEIKNIEYSETDSEVSIQASIYFEYNGFYGDMTIIQFTQELDWNGEEVIEDIKSGQLINVNGIDVLLCEQDEGCNIEYKDNLTSYYIFLESDIENAMSFVKSIS